MFAVDFDDFKRKLLKRVDANGNPAPMLAHKLITCYPGTPEYDTYMALFLSEDNVTMDVKKESESEAYTFYTLIVDPNVIKLTLDRERKKVEDAQSRRSGSTDSFV